MAVTHASSARHHTSVRLLPFVLLPWKRLHKTHARAVTYRMLSCAMVSTVSTNATVAAVFCPYIKLKRYYEGNIVRSQSMQSIFCALCKNSFNVISTDIRSVFIYIYILKSMSK